MVYKLPRRKVEYEIWVINYGRSVSSIEDYKPSLYQLTVKHNYDGAGETPGDVLAYGTMISS